jgi:NAD-dependent SIR2 family protein deacetylase
MPAVLPKQNDTPDTVFVFGAGASYSAGVPLQAELVPQLLTESDPQLQNSETATRVREFIKDNFDPQDRYPSLEEVFGLIAFCLSNDNSLSSRWTTHELLRVRGDLVKVLHYLISRRTSHSDDFRLFWQRVSDMQASVGIITTNYDTLVDEAFDSIYPQYLLDYCIDLVNHRHPTNVHPFDWWLDATKPTDVNGGTPPQRVKLVKIHGSLNWKYCSTCGQVALTPWQHQFNLKLDSFATFFDSQTHQCSFDGTPLQSLLQPPSHIKARGNYIFNRLYDQAAYLLGSAKTLVFIGYSFPEADVHIRALVKRTFKETGQIVVINKSRAADLRHRYESLASAVQYKEWTFDQFVRSELFTRLLTATPSRKPTRGGGSGQTRRAPANDRS